LEAQISASPALQKTLLEYQSMREGLRSLADVPEHQLSNERLRDAILGNGLSPQPIKNTDWSWLWMSAVAASLAVGLMIGLRRPQAVTPQLVLNDPSSAPHSSLAVNSLEQSQPSLFPSKTAIKEALPARRKEAVQATLVAYAPRPHVWHRRRHRQQDDLSTATLEAFWNGHVADKPSTSAPTLSNAALTLPPSAPPDLKPVDDTPASQVVVIEPDKDQNTGAQRATELGTASHEVVGG
jgi:hypothetical protein